MGKPQGGKPGTGPGPGFVPDGPIPGETPIAPPSGAGGPDKFPDKPEPDNNDPYTKPGKLGGSKKDPDRVAGPAAGNPTALNAEALAALSGLDLSHITGFSGFRVQNSTQIGTVSLGKAVDRDTGRTALS